MVLSLGYVLQLLNNLQFYLLYDRNDVYFVIYSNVPIDSSNMIVVPIIVLTTEYEPLIFSKPSACCLPAFSKLVNWVYFYEM